jgi:branched-chain amino acid transport system permease protein
MNFGSEHCAQGSDNAPAVGLGTIFGPAVGAFVILMLEYKLAFLGEWVLVIQGVIFVACVLLFRRGILGAIANRLHIKL